MGEVGPQDLKPRTERSAAQRRESCAWAQPLGLVGGWSFSSFSNFPPARLVLVLSRFAQARRPKTNTSQRLASWRWSYLERSEKKCLSATEADPALGQLKLRWD